MAGRTEGELTEKENRLCGPYRNNAARQTTADMLEPTHPNRSTRPPLPACGHTPESNKHIPTTISIILTICITTTSTLEQRPAQGHRADPGPLYRRAILCVNVCLRVPIHTRRYNTSITRMPRFSVHAYARRETGGNLRRQTCGHIYVHSKYDQITRPSSVSLHKNTLHVYVYIHLHVQEYAANDVELFCRGK